MDLWFAAGIALLAVWAVGTFVLAAPGWIHLLLTLGVFVLIWRVVMRGTRGAVTASPTSAPKASERPRPRP